MEDYQQRLTWLIPAQDAHLKNIENLRVELKDAKKELNALENSDMKKFKDLKKKLKKQEKKLEKLTDRLKVNQDWLSNLEGTNQHELQEKVKKTIKKQEKKVRQWSSSIDNIKGEMAKMEADRSKVMKAKAKIEKIKGEIALLKETISTYDKGIWSSNQVIAEERTILANAAQEKKKQIQNNIKIQTSEIAKHERMIEEVKGSIVQARANIAKAQKNLEYHDMNCSDIDTVFITDQTSYDVGDTVHIMAVDQGWRDLEDRHKKQFEVVVQGQSSWLKFDRSEQNRCLFLGKIILTAGDSTRNNEFQVESGNRLQFNINSWQDVLKALETGNGTNVPMKRYQWVTIN